MRSHKDKSSFDVFKPYAGVTPGAQVSEKGDRHVVHFRLCSNLVYACPPAAQSAFTAGSPTKSTHEQVVNNTTTQ